MPLLIAGGDSFTWGSELGDETPASPSKHTWTAIAAQQLGFDYCCVAKPGCANNSISRRVLKAISENNYRDIVVAVMWTYTHRSEIRLRNMYPYNTIADSRSDAEKFGIDDYYINFNAWHGLSLQEKLSFFQNGMDSGQHKFFSEQHDKLTEIGITSAADQFYKITGDPIAHHINTAKEIVFMQLFLESKNIPYFFCSATTELYGPQHQEVLQNPLWQNIAWNNWYRETGFHAWAQENNYPINGNHPGIAAHGDWVKIIMPKLKECFTRF
jgi:hypothetical protein